MIAREAEHDVADQRPDLIHEQQPRDVAERQPARLVQIGRQPDGLEPVGGHVHRRHGERERRRLAQRRPDHLSERRGVAETAADPVLHALQPDVRLRHLPPDEHDDQRRQRRRHERHPPPDPGREQIADHRGEEARERGAALQVRSVAPAHVRRHGFADQRVRHRPLAADADAGQRARREQRPEPDRQPRQQRADAVDEDRDHQERLPPVAIGERAADESADGGERERRAEQHRDFVAREREILRQRRRRDEKAEKQQVVEIEDPADERERQDPAVNREHAGAFAQQGHEVRLC